MTKVRKLIVAVIGAATVAVSQGLLPESVARWLTVVAPVLTALGVYAIPNDRPPLPASTAVFLGGGGGGGGGGGSGAGMVGGGAGGSNWTSPEGRYGGAGGQRGAVEPGSLALGLILGLLAGWLLWRHGAL